MVEALRAREFKLTPQRLLVIEILAASKTHPPARELVRQARQKAPKISVSTVYYTLNLLKKFKLIKELDFCNMDNRYEGNTEDHLHLICTQCGKIDDFVYDLPGSYKTVEEQTGFKARGMRFEFYGLCRDCLPKDG